MDIPTPIVFSHSELESAQRCPFQHQLSYIERWSRPKSEDSAAGKGTIWHSVMQAHYSAIKDAQDNANIEHGHWRGFHVDKTLAEATRRVYVGVLPKVKDPDVRDLMEWMYKGYVDYFGIDIEWEILGVEVFGQTPLEPAIADQFPMLIPGVDNRDLFQFKYYVDLLVRENGRIWVVDHKSVHNFPKDLDLDLDAQFDRYTWAMRQQGTEVFGQQYNMARRQRLKKEQELDARHSRRTTHRSDSELDSVANDMFISIYSRYQQQLELSQLGLESPRFTSSRHCNFVCDYTDPCLMGRKGYPTREYLESLNFTPNTPRHLPKERS
jgi:PD-(D/E)XK nuclease superfamily